MSYAWRSAGKVLEVCEGQSVKRTCSIRHLPAISRRRTSTATNSTIQRLSKYWIPSEGQAKGDQRTDDVHTALVRAGFLRQTHAGIFHMLPLGLRVQQKVENLIDHHMQELGALKLALSTISSERLWKASGRLTGKDSELFRFQDRKDTKLLLSPTHEEEITTLVAESVHSYRDLPLRLYQVTRKYRDEARPRQGLLRGREFLMKDLYTFDGTEVAARSTYDEVRAAYRNLFNDLGVPFLTAHADSGSIGGSLSHEYHLPSPTGEDNIITCDGCGKTMNEEVAVVAMEAKSTTQAPASEVETDIWLCVSKDRKTLVRVMFPQYPMDGAESRPNRINIYAVKAALPDLDLDLGAENPESLFKAANGSTEILLHDPRLTIPAVSQSPVTVRSATAHSQPVLLTSIQHGDTCQVCQMGKVSVVPAIEVGHTFHLGDRYSAPLNLRIKDRDDKAVTVQMGCHGIGVSRLVAAIAAVKADSQGLNWPRAVAPFCVLVVPGRDMQDAAEKVAADIQAHLSRAQTEKGWLSVPDVALDDRDKPMGWKFRDATMVGYPVLVVVGKTYSGAGEVEVQFRQTGEKRVLPLEQTSKGENATGAIVEYLTTL